MQKNKTSRLAVWALVGLGALLGFVAAQFSTDPLADAAPPTVAADRDNTNSQAQEFTPEPVTVHRSVHGFCELVFPKIRFSATRRVCRGRSRKI